MRKLKKSNWRVNEQIRAPEVRVIDAEDKQVGVMSRDEALKKAKEAELDLVEIAPKAKPPVVKIVDFGKFAYREEKKLKEQKKKTKASDLKEVRFSPFIAENDYNVRLERIKEFLADKDKVKLVVKFKGRQMGSKQFGYKLFDKVLETLGDTVSVDMEPKFLGRHLSMIISPLSGVKQQEKSKNGKNKTKDS